MYESTKHPGLHLNPFFTADLLLSTDLLFDTDLFFNTHQILRAHLIFHERPLNHEHLPIPLDKRLNQPRAHQQHKFKYWFRPAHASLALL
jgi:hypothetical protein